MMPLSSFLMNRPNSFVRTGVLRNSARSTRFQDQDLGKAADSSDCTLMLVAEYPSPEPRRPALLFVRVRAP